MWVCYHMRGFLGFSLMRKFQNNQGASTVPSWGTIDYLEGGEVYGPSAYLATAFVAAS